MSQVKVLTFWATRFLNKSNLPVLKIINLFL